MKKVIKILGRVFLTLLILSLVYIIFLYYTLSNGFRDYKKFCKNYIPLLEEFKKENNSYPKTLKNLDYHSFRYNYKDCGYKESNSSFYFYFIDGFGVGGYDSNKKEWWRD